MASGIGAPDGFTESGSDHNALPERCHRVNQLDAMVLEDELTSSLKAHFVRIFKYLPIDFVMRFEVEMDYLIRSLIYYFCIHRERGLNGDKLQNIQFGRRLTAKQKRFYLLFTVILPYSFKKWIRFMNDRGDRDAERGSVRRKIFILCQRASILLRILSLLHFIHFLFDSKYRSPIHRVLGVRMEYIDRNLSRMVSFDFMNQQIVWNEISNFLLFVFPLFNFHKISLWIRRQIKNAQFLWTKGGDDEVNGKKGMRPLSLRWRSFYGDKF